MTTAPADAGSAQTSGAEPDELPVRHNSDRHRFYIPLDEGQAHLDYDRIDSETVDFAHTYVSPGRRGEGLASRVVEGALEHAREEGLKVVPSCPFVASFLKDHPEYQDLRA
jgi:predicted GNAT family acetyltransferase